MNSIRIGYGIDIHKFDSNVQRQKPLIIGGIQINYKNGLEGNSDADVLTHSIIDSILGAFCLGDIGTWFPVNNEFKNSDSCKLLRLVVSKTQQKHKWQLINMDSVIILDKPKIMNKHDKAIRKNISNILLTDINNISIKAKTTENIIFHSNKNGIIAITNILIQVIN